MRELLPVTVIVPTRNEEKNLPTCLSGLVGFFQEIVIVDSESSDLTRRIASDAGVKVVDFVWNGGFPKKRNWMLLNYEFTTPWVLFVDADEHLTEQFRDELSAKIKIGACVGYWLNYRVFFRGMALKHGITQRKLALFRVGAGLYENIDDPGWSALDMEVHEHPVLQGRIEEISSPIDHWDFRGMYHFIARHNDYSSWEARRYLTIDGRGEGNHTRRQHLKYRYIERWWYPFAYFFLTYVIRLGCLDGRAGFVFAVMKFCYFLEIQEKIAEAKTDQYFGK
jgi:glycosyltransferase involved in cell wall biosynthesis